MPIKKKKENDSPTTAAPKKAKKKKYKPFVLWAVIDNEHPDEPVTFTASHEEALMALDQYIYLKHYAHFRRWCPLHGLPVDHATSWVSYSESVLTEEFSGTPLYAIVQIDYEPNVVASLFRTFNNCTPLGLPFDTEEEIADYADRIESTPDAELSEIEQALNLLLDDIDNDEVAEAAEVKAHCPVYFKHPDDNNNSDTNKGGNDKKYDA